MGNKEFIEAVRTEMNALTEKHIDFFKTKPSAKAIESHLTCNQLVMITDYRIIIRDDLSTIPDYIINEMMKKINEVKDRFEV